MSRITRVSLGSSRGRASGAKRRGASEAEARPTLEGGDMESNKAQHDFSEDDFYDLTDDDHKRMTYLFQLFSDAQGALKSGAKKEELLEQIELAVNGQQG